MRTVAIRADSSTLIGSGHLMRCLTLAQRLRTEEEAEVHFISRDLEGNLHALIRQRQFRLHVLPRHEFDPALEGYAKWLTVPQAIDAAETSEILKSMRRVDKLVIDCYAIDIEWERAVRPFVEEIFVIDDLANRKHDCDVLLDQNFRIGGLHRYNGLVPEHCELRLGLKYALLRAEFYEVKRHLRRRDGSIGNVLVFYGGVDLTNETLKALQALALLNRPELIVNAVVGKSNVNKEAVEEYCARHGFNYLCQVDDMAELMNDADLALGAGGTTTWERMFLGLPTVLTSIADNQSGCEALADEGFIVYVGRAQECTAETIVRTLECLTPERLLQMQKRCLAVWN